MKCNRVRLVRGVLIFGRHGEGCHGLNKMSYRKFTDSLCYGFRLNKNNNRFFYRKHYRSFRESGRNHHKISKQSKKPSRKRLMRCCKRCKKRRKCSGVMNIEWCKLCSKRCIVIVLKARNVMTSNELRCLSCMRKLTRDIQAKPKWKHNSKQKHGSYQYYGKHYNKRKP